MEHDEIFNQPPRPQRCAKRRPLGLFLEALACCFVSALVEPRQKLCLDHCLQADSSNPEPRRLTLFWSYSVLRPLYVYACVYTHVTYNIYIYIYTHTIYLFLLWGPNSLTIMYLDPLGLEGRSSWQYPQSSDHSTLETLTT